MSEHPSTNYQSPGGDPDDEISLLDLLQVVAENLRLLVLVPLIAGVIALGISFSITPTFTANTTFLPPQPQQSTASIMLQSLGPLAAIGGGGVASNPADRYVAFVQSRSVRDAVIERFDLMNRYATKSREAAREGLGGSTKVSIGKTSLITVEVKDRDPTFAADLANAQVEELSKFLGRLAITEAQARRAFYEQQLKKAKDGLVAAETALKGTGISESAIKSSPAAAVGAVASLMAQVSAKEVEIGAMRGYLTESAPDFQRAQAELRALRVQLLQNEKSNQPAIGGSDYVAKYRDFKYYEALFELMAKQYEMARIDESRDGGVIQVVDKAMPPERKSGPAKARNAIMTTLVVGLALLLFVFLRHALRNVGRDPKSAQKLGSLRESLRRAFSKR